MTTSYGRCVLRERACGRATRAGRAVVCRAVPISGWDKRRDRARTARPCGPATSRAGTGGYAFRGATMWMSMVCCWGRVAVRCSSSSILQPNLNAEDMPDAPANGASSRGVGRVLASVIPTLAGGTTRSGPRSPTTVPPGRGPPVVRWGRRRDAAARFSEWRGASPPCRSRLLGFSRCRLSWAAYAARP